MTNGKTKRSLFLGIGVLTAGLVIACGGDDSDSQATGATGAGAATAASGASSGASGASTGATNAAATNGATTAGATGSNEAGAVTTAASGRGLFIPTGLEPETSGPSEGDGIFTPDTNREIYQKISSDYQEIVALADVVNDGEPLPAPEILLLYEAGMHTRLGNASRSLRQFARDPGRSTEFSEAAAFYGTPTFLDTPIVDAIAGSRSAEDYSDAQRRQAILKGIQRILYHWSLRYVLNAEETLNEGWVDEAWAIYVGEPGEDGSYPNSLAALARNREENFGREGTLDTPMREAMAAAQQAAKDDDSEAYLTAANDIYSRFHAIFYLSTVRYLGQATASAQEGDAERAGVQQVEGLSFYQSIQPRVAAADPAADEAIVAFFNAEPESLTPEARDAALQALNGTASALLLNEDDLVTSFE